MFFALGHADSQSLYRDLLQTPDRRIARNGMIFVRGNVRLINRGSYFYASSHAPLYKLRIPENTFTVTCFRDPVKRVVSLYNMFMDYFVNGVAHTGLAGKQKWLRGSFDDFLDRIPPEYLLNQIYMFSRRFDVDEAVAATRTLSHYFFTEDFDRGVEELSRKTGLHLRPVHVRKAAHEAEISERSLDGLRKRLTREYAFLETLKSMNHA